MREKNSRWVKFMNSVLATLDWMMCGIPSKISSKRSGGKTSKSGGAGASSMHSSQHNSREASMSVAAIVLPSKKVASEPIVTPVVVGEGNACDAGGHVTRKSRTGSLMRTSFATGAASLGWSGKHMEEHQSRKAFAMLTAMSHDDNEDSHPEEDDEAAAAKVAERLVEEFPDHFVPVAGDDKLAAALQEVVRSSRFANDVEGGTGVQMVRAAENTKESA